MKRWFERAMRPQASDSRTRRYASERSRRPPRSGGGTAALNPGQLTLRLRLLTHCPAFSLLSALLLIDRSKTKLRVLEDDEVPHSLGQAASGDAPGCV